MFYFVRSFERANDCFRRPEQRFKYQQAATERKGVTLHGRETSESGLEEYAIHCRDHGSILQMLSVIKKNQVFNWFECGAIADFEKKMVGQDCKKMEPSFCKAFLDVLILFVVFPHFIELARLVLGHSDFAFPTFSALLGHFFGSIYSVRYFLPWQKFSLFVPY